MFAPLFSLHRLYSLYMQMSKFKRTFFNQPITANSLMCPVAVWNSGWFHTFVCASYCGIVSRIPIQYECTWSQTTHIILPVINYDVELRALNVVHTSSSTSYICLVSRCSSSMICVCMFFFSFSVFFFPPNMVGIIVTALDALLLLSKTLIKCRKHTHAHAYCFRHALAWWLEKLGTPQRNWRIVVCVKRQTM